MRTIVIDMAGGSTKTFKNVTWAWVEAGTLGVTARIDNTNTTDYFPLGTWTHAKYVQPDPVPGV